MYDFDAIDLEILRLLQTDSRITIKEMAARMNLSTTPIFERTKRLEKNGVIRAYVALLNPKKLNLKLNAFIHISMQDHSKSAIEAFVSHVVSFPEILECHHISGKSDFLLKLCVEDIEKYNQFVMEKLSVVPNIADIESSFSLSVRKESHIYPI